MDQEDKHIICGSQPSASEEADTAGESIKQDGSYTKKDTASDLCPGRRRHTGWLLDAPDIGHMCAQQAHGWMLRFNELDLTRACVHQAQWDGQGREVASLKRSETGPATANERGGLQSAAGLLDFLVPWSVVQKQMYERTTLLTCTAHRSATCPHEASSPPHSSPSAAA